MDLWASDIAQNISSSATGRQKYSNLVLVERVLHSNFELDLWYLHLKSRNFQTELKFHFSTSIQSSAASYDEVSFRFCEKNVCVDHTTRVGLYIRIVNTITRQEEFAALGQKIAVEILIATGMTTPLFQLGLRLGAGRIRVFYSNSRQCVRSFLLYGVRHLDPQWGDWRRSCRHPRECQRR